MLASKYADAPPASPKDSSRRASSAADAKPLPPLPASPNGAAQEQAGLPHSRNASRDQKPINGSPKAPRFPRSSQKNSTSDARIEETPASHIERARQPEATVVPIASSGAPAVQKPAQPDAGVQSREALPMPEPPKAQAPQAKIPAKKMTSKKGRPCIIRIPAETFAASVSRKPMSPADISARIQKFETDGYNVKGFDHDNGPGKQPDDGLDVRSRFLFHASQTSQSLPADARPAKPIVTIPNKQTWEQYRNDLVEAKLKALGVIPADPEPAPEAEPEEMDMSMQEHQMYPGMAASPPPMSSSVNSQHHWQGPTPFSASFSDAGFTNNTSLGGIGSPVSSMGGPQMQRPGHLSRQSTFNFNFPAAFNPALQQQFSPQPGQGGPLGFHRGGSPSLAGNAIPRLSSALSRNSPDPFAEHRQPTPRLPNAGLQNAPGFHVQSQMQPPMQPPAKNPRRMTLMNNMQYSQPGSANMTPQGSNQGFEDQDFVSTPPNDNDSSYADLAYPTPRGHRSNLSQNLEREAEKPQYYPGEYVENERDETESQAGASKDNSGISHLNKPSHTSSGSTSKFNVAAKEFKFDPKAAHHRQMSSTKNPFMPEKAPSITSKPAVSFITAHANGETTGGGNFDARASSFKPPSQGDFSFGSTPFDFSKQTEPKPEPQKEEAEAKEEPNDKGEKKSKIFGGINFADFVKPTKKSKAIPIVNPNALPKKEPTPAPQETVEDETGRLAQDVSRHKRGRTAAPGGDDIPRFATPSSPGLTPQPESIKSKSPAPPALAVTEERKPEITEKNAAAVGPAPAPAAATEDSKAPQKNEDDETAHWSDFGIDAPKTPPRRVQPKSGPLVDLKQPNDSMDTTVPRSVVSDATSAAAQAQHWQSLLDSSPPRLPSPSRLPHFPGREFDPDFHEIDAIMEQLNEQPHHGAEEEARAPSPAKTSVVNEPLGGPSPELREPETEPELQPGGQPEPTRGPELERQSRLTAPTLSHEKARSRSRDVSITPADWVKDQRSMRGSASPIRKLNTAKEPEVSDWDEMLSDKEAANFLPKTQFFDTRVKSIFQEILKDQLAPVQKSLDKAVKSMPGREAREAWPLTDRADKTESDADDEDNAEEMDAQRSRPLRSDKKLDKIRSIVQEAVASQQSSESTTKRELDSLRSALLEAISDRPAAPQLDIKDVRSAVQEIVNSKPAPPPQLSIDDIRLVVHDIVNSKPSIPAGPQFDGSELRNIVQEVVNAKSASPTATSAAPLDSQEIRAIVQEVVGAKQDSTIRLEDEMRLRNDAERRAHDLQRLLNLSEKEVTLFKEASENTEQQIRGFRDDRSDAQEKIAALERIERDLRGRTAGLTTEISNLQGTLEEYRTSSQRWRSEIDTVKKARESLQHTIEDLRAELHGTKQSRDNLGAKFEKLQAAMTTATSNLHKERENFRARDEQLSKESAVLGSRLEEEFRTRQRLERELDRQGVHERNAVKATVTLEELRNTNQRLMAENLKLREENQNERNSAQLHEREAVEAKDIARSEIQRNKTLLDAEVEVANMRTESTRTDLETRLEHVRGELSAARYENAKIRQEHKKNLEESHTQRIQAVREASESANHAREEERKHFERLTVELSKQHDEAMKRALDERQRAEVHFNETHKLSSEKNALLEDKIRHLDDKVHVAQSAAKAAAEAAQQHTAAKAKEAAAQREHLQPSERVSPQALRESLHVLQEQLQERERRIEILESDLEKVDKELPNKYKDRETEISWLRELLNVRLDDISELVNLLSLDNFDRVAARDAAIRIRANLQMEQQEKERLIGRASSSGGMSRGTANNPLPSLNDIQNFATPRAAQLAAAWGKWAGQSPSLTSLRNAVSGQLPSENGTPSKPRGLGRLPPPNVADNANAAQNFLSGLMTPPASNLRRTPTPQRASSREPEREREQDEEEMSNMSDAQPLSLEAELGQEDESITEGSPSKMMTGGRSGRPYTPPAQGGRHEDPITPPLAHKGSHDLGAEMERAGAEDDAGAEIAADSKLEPLDA